MPVAGSNTDRFTGGGTVRPRRRANTHSFDTRRCAIASADESASRTKMAPGRKLTPTRPAMSNVVDLPGVVSILRNSQAQDAASQDSRGCAHEDEPTELPNWRTFYGHVQRAIGSIKCRSSNRFAVLFIRLDDFRAVKGEFGRIIADKLLAIIARRLEFCVGSEDIVARIGGDEFAILLNGIDGISDADEAAERIGILMRQPATIEKRNVRATVSVGIAVGNPKYDHPEAIVRDADAAVDAAKAAGRARSNLFGT
jgi:diguanylate cyclase (GGDEF)-like protein